MQFNVLQKEEYVCLTFERKCNLKCRVDITRLKKFTQFRYQSVRVPRLTLALSGGGGRTPHPGSRCTQARQPCIRR